MEWLYPAESDHFLALLRRGRLRDIGDVLQPSDIMLRLLNHWDQAVSEIAIDFNKLEIYEAGGLLLTVLAYPGARDADEARSSAHKALCSLALQALAQADPVWAETPQPIRPIYILCSDKQIEKSLRALQRRIRDRMAAARMAIAFLKDAEATKPPPLPEGVKRLSINELSKLVLSDTTQSEPENIETRIWRPSRPVIHLAAALQVLMQLGVKAAGSPVTFFHVLLYQDVIRWVVTEAQKYEELIEKSQQIHVDPSMLIRVRLAGA
jgi:hypothetical protein